VAVARRASRSRFTLILLILTSATLITLDLRGFAPLQDARGAVGDVFGPVGDAAGNAFEPVGDAWDGAVGYDDLESENEALRDRIEELEGEIALRDDAKEQLEELLAANDLQYVEDIESTLARVISSPEADFAHEIELDKGSDDGLRAGLTVVNQAGLVGRIKSVTANRSVVQLITDPGLDVGVRLSEHDDAGVARGQGRDQDLLVYTGIDIGLEIEEGELVTTSGHGGALFPGDIPVGRVSQVITSAGDLKQDLQVEPLASLDSLTWVNVLLWEPPE
jgi:rod shape-determining protein MreC